MPKETFVVMPDTLIAKPRDLENILELSGPVSSPVTSYNLARWSQS